ncbi:alpha/beta hydrolase [Corynebacterium sp. A21]|uniref:alpha/beta hydrolase n=1 Tax=Corynebacterium sp. A21 TaxID=3457318 RepID=UPI003FD28EA1
MSRHSRTFRPLPTVLSLTLSATLGLTLASPVNAASSATSSGSSSGSLLEEAVIGSNSDPGSSGSAIDATLGLLEGLGSSEVPASFFPGSSYPGMKLPLDESITRVELLERQVTDPISRLERWTIASPAMKRAVEVQVVPAAGGAAAPMLYLLDGVGAPRENWWLTHGDAQAQFGERVHLILPTQAQASMYADWLRDDPNLGRHQWETFITQELAPLLQEELAHNGHSGIGGISMGATGAVHIGNRHPELFDATFGLSGCYSPMDLIGRQNAHLTVTTRGGNLDNLYGRYGSERWHYHDTVGDPSGLRDQRVYLSAGNGVFAPEDVANYANGNWVEMSSGAALERSSLECTQLLDDAMTQAGFTGLRVDYPESGTHDWHTFRRQIPAAWEHISPALYR